jgi:hypothetical protein
MANKINGITALENHVRDLINRACDIVSEKVRLKLEEHIKDDYYAQYTPLFYERTNAFLQSAAKFQLVNKSGISFRVYIDTSGMDYGHFSPEAMLGLAAEGYHGSHNIQTSGRFWDDFLKECNEEYLKKELKQALNSVGLKIK